MLTDRTISDCSRIGNTEPGPALANRQNSETLGYSVEGRPLKVHYCGDPKAPVRIFVLAGQHGDEPETRQAATEFIAHFNVEKFRTGTHVAVLADANPDGASAGTRRNALDIDINRDHLLLSAPETAAVHAFVSSWQPDLIVDVHTYRPWRRELMAFDFVYPQEIMIDFPTNPAVSTSLGAAVQRKAMAFLQESMAKKNIRTDRYTIVRSGTVRHSNMDIVDARNGLALRFAIPTILVEGRRSSPDDFIDFTPPAAALLCAIDSIVEWAVDHAKQLSNRPSRFQDEDVIPVRCRYSGSKTTRHMEMQSASKGEVTRVRIPGNYLSTVRTTSSIRLPVAYGVPCNLTAVLSLLSRHGLAASSPATLRASSTDVYQIETVTPAGEPDKPAIPQCIAKAVTVNLDDFVLFSTMQTGGRLLALLLEPESQFGPSRLHELSETLLPGQSYPIIRVV